MRFLSFKHIAPVFALAALSLLSVDQAKAQFTTKWLDIGDFQSNYIQIGANCESGVCTAPQGWEHPSIQRYAVQSRAEGFWVGTTDWTDPQGRSYPYFVARTGPRNPGLDVAYPQSNKLYSRWEDTSVKVDGLDSYNHIAVVDSVDANLPADRVVETNWNQAPGIQVKRRVYAYGNQYQDDYQIVEYTFTNTGNTDDDPEAELPDQTLHGVYFYWLYRWRGSEQASQQASAGQVWGKYNMIDVVGDGHSTFPVDFTAVYAWYGNEPNFQSNGFTSLGMPLTRAFNSGYVADADTVGRLSGTDMDGQMTLYAPNSTTDPTYDMAQQPASIGYADQDGALMTDGQPQELYYTQGLASGRVQPTYAKLIEPTGEYWNPTKDASGGNSQGGFAPSVAYGPYEMAPGESVHIVMVYAADGLPYKAQVEIGKSFKRHGASDSYVIQYDANGDGQITCLPFDYSAFDLSKYGTGNECLTKNQWVLTARDTLFKDFYHARALWKLAGGDESGTAMSKYPIPEPPRPPKAFTVDGKPDKIELRWELPDGGPNRTGWEVYRTSNYTDNLPYTCLAGTGAGCQSAMLAASATSFDDATATRGVNYFYYVQAVGDPQPNDPEGLTGTPGGQALKSSLYYTLTYIPTNLKRPPFGDPALNHGWKGNIEDSRVVPNPVNLASQDAGGGANGIRWAEDDRIAFLNIPGQCTITIYTETGQLIKKIEHTNGTGDESWNLTTDARQLLVSGIYIAVIEDTDGARVFRKFVVIR